jgi:hypothetical protein
MSDTMHQETDAPEPDTDALMQALLRLPPDTIDREIRPIAPAIADCLQAHRSAENAKHAHRMFTEMMREIDRINRERTHLLTKDQLRLLVFGADTDIAQLAAAELLTREPASNRTLSHANGDVADIGYANDGSIYAHVYRAGALDHWLPAIGRA